MPNAVIVDAFARPRTSGTGNERISIRSTWPRRCCAPSSERNGLDGALVEDVIMGCVMQVGEQGINIARNGGARAGFPETTGGHDDRRQCGSSQQAGALRGAGRSWPAPTTS